jgi:hypothetical protein
MRISDIKRQGWVGLSSRLGLTRRRILGRAGFKYKLTFLYCRFHATVFVVFVIHALPLIVALLVAYAVVDVSNIDSYHMSPCRDCSNPLQRLL